MINSVVLAVVITLFGSSFAGSYGGPPHRNHYHGHSAAVPLASAYKSHGPQVYKHSIPAAAIRNVETVGVTKTITPVVTKTTTRLTHSEPALSIGHVQGYTQTQIGSPKVAPVQFNTQYTSYSNPTVGINGPVSYAGPAVSLAGYALAAAPGIGYGGGPVVASGYGGSVASGYGGSVASGYGGSPVVASGYGGAPVVASGYGASPVVASGYGGSVASGYGASPVVASGYGASPVVASGYGASPVVASGYGSYGGYGYSAAPAYGGHQGVAAYAIPQTEYASQAVAVAEIAPSLSIESYGTEAYEAPAAAFTDVHSGQAIYGAGGHYGHSAYGRRK